MLLSLMSGQNPLYGFVIPLRLALLHPGFSPPATSGLQAIENIERSFFALRHSEKYSTLLSSTHRSSLIPRGTAHNARRFSEGPSCTGLFYCAAALQRFFLAPLSQQLGRLAKVQPRSDPPEPDCQATSPQKTNCTERIRSHIDIQQIEQVRQFQRFLCKVTSRLQTLRVKNGIKYVNIK